MSRVTNLMTSRLVLTGLEDASGRLNRSQQKLSTGKEILRPSDDPLATHRALTYREEVAGLKQYQTNVTDGEAWQSVTDVALQRVNDRVARARELVIQGASDGTSAEGRKAIAEEIDQIVQSIKQEGNATYAGRFIFGGTKTDAPPYDMNGADTYNGNSETFARQIGPGVSVPVNTLLQDLLGNGAGAGPGQNDDRLLHTLRDVAGHLRSSNPADAELLRTSDITRIDANHDVLLGQLAEVGARANRLDVASGRLAEIEENVSDLLSQTEDADMAKTMVDFSMQQAVYQAALRSGANIVQASLLDFLR
jgi:flagellar hook-associated protein 3 FlgL